MRLCILLVLVTCLLSKVCVANSSGRLARAHVYGQVSTYASKASIEGQAWSLKERRLTETVEDAEVSSATLVEEAEVQGKDDVSRATAACLMASLILQAGVMHLVNHRDKDIRQYAWTLLNDTASIFTAVPWHQAFSAYLDDNFSGEDDLRLRVAIVTGHFLLIYAGIQAIAIIMAKHCGDMSLTAACKLGAHLCGFAGKKQFDVIMQAKPFRNNCGFAIIVILIAVVCFTVYCLVSLTVRRRFFYPRMHESRSELLDDAISDVENDMVSLCVGFLLSQVIRFAIHGELPTADSDEPDDHEQSEAAVLLLCALLFGVGSFAFIKLETSLPFSNRLLAIVKMTIVFAMSWCLLYWGQWEIMDTHFTNHLVLGRVVMAVSFTVGSCLLVFGLDFVADRAGWIILQRGLRLLALGLGLSVAFAWEQTFDFAIESVVATEGMISEAQGKTILAIVLTITVGPAWAWYILPKVSPSEKRDNLSPVQSFSKSSAEVEEIEGGDQGELKQASDERQEPSLPALSTQPEPLRKEPPMYAW